jgi:hypothetical protein
MKGKPIFQLEILRAVPWPGFIAKQKYDNREKQGIQMSAPSPFTFAGAMVERLSLHCLRLGTL